MTKALVNPLNHIAYSSFYIYALGKVLGKDNVRFSRLPFRDLTIGAQKASGLLFVLQDGETVKKFFIYGGDTWIIDEEIYQWCDVYASVNANFGNTPGREKLISLAPSFGIRCWDKGELIFKAFANAIQYLLSCHDNKLKTFVGNYKRLLNRPTYEEMIYESGQDHYIFFCCTLWYNDEWNQNDSKVNARRASFIRACKTIEDIEFEGGFVAQEGRSSIDLFKDCLAERCYPYSEWLQKTKRSALVFNTPAFWECHGWKLGEYLALGKAIISTPLSNNLPAPLTHGVNIHFVNGDLKSVKEAISYIIEHPDYKKRLEQGARAYWESYGAPEKSLELIGIH